MAIKDTDRKARANYKKKVKVVRVELYGTDEDIKAALGAVEENDGTVQGYIKRLIREDIIRAKVEMEKKKLEEERWKAVLAGRDKRRTSSSAGEVQKPDLFGENKTE